MFTGGTTQQVAVDCGDQSELLYPKLGLSTKKGIAVALDNSVGFYWWQRTLVVSLNRFQSSTVMLCTVDEKKLDTHSMKHRMLQGLHTFPCTHSRAHSLSTACCEYLLVLRM